MPCNINRRVMLATPLHFYRQDICLVRQASKANLTSSGEYSKKKENCNMRKTLKFYQSNVHFIIILLLVLQRKQKFGEQQPRTKLFTKICFFTNLWIDGYDSIYLV